MIIRRATMQDAPAIRALVFDVLRTYGLQTAPSTTDADLYDLQRFYFDTGGDFSVLVHASDIIGTVGIRRVSDRVGELAKMYLRESYRGRGLGKRLMEHALAKARELGLNELMLETSSVLTEAVRLYERYGFRQLRRFPLAARCDIVMQLTLPPESPTLGMPP